MSWWMFMQFLGGLFIVVVAFLRFGFFDLLHISPYAAISSESWSSLFSSSIELLRRGCWKTAGVKALCTPGLKYWIERCNQVQSRWASRMALSILSSSPSAAKGCSPCLGNRDPIPFRIDLCLMNLVNLHYTACFPCISSCDIFLCSYVTVTFMLESMATANALLKLGSKVTSNFCCFIQAAQVQICGIDCVDFFLLDRVSHIVWCLMDT